MGKLSASGRCRSQNKIYEYELQIIWQFWTGLLIPPAPPPSNSHRLLRVIILWHAIWVVVAQEDYCYAEIPRNAFTINCTRRISISDYCNAISHLENSLECLLHGSPSWLNHLILLSKQILWLWVLKGGASSGCVRWKYYYCLGLWDD